LSSLDLDVEAEAEEAGNSTTMEATEIDGQESRLSQEQSITRERELEFSRRENELLRREVELIRRENELLRQGTQVESANGSNVMVAHQPEGPMSKISLTNLKEMLPTFDRKKRTVSRLARAVAVG